MKLWRRRPLSVDLTQAEEMPPSVVYISPSNHAVSKRCSFVNFEGSSKPIGFSEVTSFNSTDKATLCPNRNHVDDIPLQSFRDYNNIRVSFEDSTIRSSRLSSKTYLTPVSAEWLPVKDVMKIKRSASVPFQSKQPPIVQPQTTNETTQINMKTHTSLAEKIRTLFRTRSNSRSSKNVLTPITELKSNNICLRNSRSRTKDVEGCKSMYEPSRVNDGEFSTKLNNVLKDCGKKSLKVCIDNGTQSTVENKQSFHKLNKKNKPISEFQKRVKECQVSRDKQKFISSKGFSESVISHTTSSAAKVLKIKFNDKPIDKRTISKPSISKYEFPLSPDLSQSITATNIDKKKLDLYKSNSLNNNIRKIDGKNFVQRQDCSQSNKFVQLNEQNVVNRSKILDSTSNQIPDDDYVRLAEIDLSLPPAYNIMAQSIHEAIISELAKSNHEYENIDFRNTRANHQQQVLTKYTNDSREIISKPPNGQQKRRPISCIAVVESDNRIHSYKNNKYLSNESPKNNYPKSPYLSQYTKLYSLKVTDGQIMYAQQPEYSDCDIMTRSQTSCPYKSSTMLGKENSGKISIDSGLVDDLSMNYRHDSIIKT